MGVCCERFSASLRYSSRVNHPTNETTNETTNELFTICPRMCNDIHHSHPSLPADMTGLAVRGQREVLMLRRRSGRNRILQGEKTKQKMRSIVVLYMSETRLLRKHTSHMWSSVHVYGWTDFSFLANAFAVALFCLGFSLWSILWFARKSACWKVALRSRK